MSKKKKKPKFNSQSIVEKVRRDNELKSYNKLLSLRPSIVLKSKKDYKRKWKMSDYED